MLCFLALIVHGVNNFLYSFIFTPFWTEQFISLPPLLSSLLGNLLYPFSGILQCHSGLFQCFILCINWHTFAIKTVIFHTFVLLCLFREHWPLLDPISGLEALLFIRNRFNTNFSHLLSMSGSQISASCCRISSWNKNQCAHCFKRIWRSCVSRI